jgi:hypothetical protein
VSVLNAFFSTWSNARQTYAEAAPQTGAQYDGSSAVGNNRYLIQTLTGSGQTVTATLCNYRYGLAHEQENGTFVSVLNKAVNDQGIDTLRVRLTAPADESNNALPHRPAAPAPAGVFGDWKITGLLTDFGRLHPARCAARRQQRADRGRDRRGHLPRQRLRPLPRRQHRLPDRARGA